MMFVDLDVHQGDGTAAIFEGDASVYTWSVHCAAQPFPHRLQTSDFDVALPAGTTDSEYLRVWSPGYHRLQLAAGAVP